MRHLTAFVALLSLAACAPFTTYYRAGVPVRSVFEAETQCKVAALKDAPVAERLVRGPPQYVPSRKICDAHGNCIFKQGFFLPGDVYSVDVNADLRQRVEQQCMAGKGFELVDIPTCAPDIAARAPADATSVLPQLSETSCVITNPDGTFQIVN